MDQNAFRALLAKPPATPPAAAPRAAPAASAPAPAFKPRPIARSASQRYRDRAAERRLGTTNDYAHLDALVQDFARSTANDNPEEAEAKRSYLGGDAEHSVLVKGLDFALLEQNKARGKGGGGASDDEDLELAFREAGQGESVKEDASVSSKRSRADIIRQLKESRASRSGSTPPAADLSKKDEARALEAAKLAGRFKPIGKPDVQEKGKKGKKRTAEGEEKRRKKRKVEGTAADVTSATPELSREPAPAAPQSKPEPEPEPEEVDIFADAGEYTGIDLGEDEDEDEDERANRAEKTEKSSGENQDGEDSGDDEVGQHENEKWKRGLFAEDQAQKKGERGSALSSALRDSISASAKALPVSAPSHPPDPSLADQSNPDAEDADETAQPTKLVPLSSSALPSVRELLELDDQERKRVRNRGKGRGRGRGGGPSGGGGREAKEEGGESGDDEAGKSGKKGGAKKEKGKAEGKGKMSAEGKGKMSAEAKAERDYQRLKSYTDKKNASGGG